MAEFYMVHLQKGYNLLFGLAEILNSFLESDLRVSTNSLSNKLPVQLHSFSSVSL